MTRHIEDALELRIIERGNGYIHLRASAYRGNANGLGPEWNGAGCYHAIKHLALGAAL